MTDTEVHSLILDEVNQVDDDDLRGFLRGVIRHERDILEDQRGEYTDHYKELVDSFVANQSLQEFNDE